MNMPGTFIAEARRYRVTLRQWLPIDFGFMNKLTCFLMAYFLFGFQNRYGMEPFDLSVKSVLCICYSIFTANVAVQLINLAASKTKPLRIAMNLLFIVFFTLINVYYLITHIQLSCALIIENFSLGFYRESWHTIIGVFPTWFLVTLGISIVILLAMHLWKKKLLSPAEYTHRSKKTATAALLYTLILLLPVKTHDQFTELMRGIIRYPFQDPMIDITINGYPYLRTFNATPGIPRDGKKPDIILIMVESFNANVVMKKTPEGKTITPVFNSLIPRGLYVEHFYGNSVQTSKGQAATLLSVMPSIRGKILTSFPELSFKALPAILRDSGYETIFLQAARELDFDNTMTFMKKAGFQHVHSAYEFLTDADAPRVWGWGPEDGLFYNLCLRQMDSIRRRNGGKPIFAVLMTVSNHMWFDHVPKEKCRIYSDTRKDSRDIDKRYANSINLSDAGLAELLRGIAARPEFADTAVIITGDHSFPINEHGISHNEIGYYDEIFRTPMLVLWKNRLAPRTLKGAFSQLDIAPTVMDIAGVSGIKTHFLGQSLIPPDTKAGPVYLIQPYNGQYLGVIEYPYKYVHHTETGQEYLFNLQSNPLEEKNLIRNGDPKVLEGLRMKLKNIYINQKVLNENKLWPSNMGRARVN